MFKKFFLVFLISCPLYAADYTCTTSLAQNTEGKMCTIFKSVPDNIVIGLQMMCGMQKGEWGTACAEGGLTGWCKDPKQDVGVDMMAYWYNIGPAAIEGMKNECLSHGYEWITE